MGRREPLEILVPWVLDLAFREEKSWARKDFSPRTGALLRHRVLNVLT